MDNTASEKNKTDSKFNCIQFFNSEEVQYIISRINLIFQLLLRIAKIKILCLNDFSQRLYLIIKITLDNNPK